jgi:mono/diheme cytochrome c family protein
MTRSLSSLFLFVGLLVACNPLPNPGKEVYVEKCQNCHGIDGKGLKGLYPPLTNADYIKGNREKIACIIMNGMEGEILVNGKTYNEKMPSNPLLTEAEITNLLNYINSAFLPENKTFTLKEVSNNLRDCK